MIKRFVPIKKGYTTRIYPNNEQKELINKTIGSSRFVYNHFLDYSNKNDYETYTKFCKLLTKLKKKYKWLKEVDSLALQQSLRDLDKAFKNFFKGQNNYPKFKSKKKARLSYRTQRFVRPGGTTNIKVENNKIKLPKIGWIKFNKHQEIEGKIKNVTVSKKAGKYYISICLENVLVQKVDYSKQNEIGIDLGLKNFAITSDGKKVENPKHLAKYEDKLAKLQRKLAKKEEGSNNWLKVKKKIQTLHKKIADVRKDFLHKLSTQLTKENQLIAIEDLNIKGMLKNSKLAKHISDVSWSKFTTMLEYKGNWYDCIIQQVNRFFASSQTCNECGTKNPKVKDLSVRFWTCECGANHDRDINASKNILNQAKKELALTN